MMATKMAKVFTFFELMRQYKVEVPIIQRDYAQGRNNPKASSIRKKFVSDLLNTLSGSAQDGHPLDLAFVYGYIHNGVFVPVDGQQRLTTLFLLHLYLVKRCMAMPQQECGGGKVAETLTQFTYATRQSSREFCERISAGNRQIVPSDNDLKGFIREQAWFFVEWGNDPTIAGMLEVLQEIHSQLSEICKGQTDVAKFLETMLKLLCDDKCPIRFHFLDMGLGNLSDDLYLKMNARGLPLDDFERFKSDLEDYLEETHLDIMPGFIDPTVADWANAEPHKKTSWKFDLIWGDEFWHRYREHFQTRMMSVVSRSFSVVARTLDPISEEWIQLLSAIAEGKAEYISFDAFRGILESKAGEAARIMNQLARFWDNIICLRECNILTSPAWPLDKTVDILAPTNMEERVVFAMLSLLTEGITASKKSEIDEWLRIVWNIMENSNVEEANHTSYIRLFNGWIKERTPILQLLSALEYNGELAQAQIRQECKKARLMIGDNGKEWERLIKRLEKHPLLRGNLYTLMVDNPEINVFRQRVEAFEALFPYDVSRPKELFQYNVDKKVAACCRKMIYEGDGDGNMDCSQPRGRHYRFPVNKMALVDMLSHDLHDGFVGSAFQKALCFLLAHPDDLQIDDSSMETNEKLKNHEGHLTWQYYFIKYPDLFISEAVGYYNWNKDVDMPMWRMTTNNLKGWHCNPFLLAISQDKKDTVWQCLKSGDGKLHLGDSDITVKMLDNELGFRVHGCHPISNDDMCICEKDGDTYKVLVKPGNDVIVVGRWMVAELRKQHGPRTSTAESTSP
jgi:hypothetical protein